MQGTSELQKARLDQLRGMSSDHSDFIQRQVFAVTKKNHDAGNRGLLLNHVADGCGIRDISADIASLAVRLMLVQILVKNRVQVPKKMLS